jgi:hypothetical protein
MGGTNSGTPSGERSADQPTATLLLTRDGGSDALDRLDVTADTTEVLVVSVDRSATDIVDDWRSEDGTLPATFGLISFEEFARSAAMETDDGPSRRPLPGRDVTVTTMSDPGNLRRLGTAVTLYLDDWTDTGRETSVYVDDLTPFVESAGLEPTFQFLHLLIQTTTGTDATLLVRADASTTDERTVNTLRPLFDAVIDSDDTPPPALDTDTLHELLRNPRRRFALRSLFEDDEASLNRLAGRLAAWENGTNDPTDAERSRAYTALASVHVPRLAEAGLVVFDRSEERVTLSDVARGADRLEGYLDESFDG